MTENLGVSPGTGIALGAEVPQQPFDPSRPSVNHDRSGLWAPDPLDEFRNERREPTQPVATQREIKFVAPEARRLVPALASIDRHGLWSFASGAVFGALGCVILLSALTTSTSPPSEPFDGELATDSAAPPPLCPAASEVLPAQISIANEPAVVENASQAPTLTVTRQAVSQVPVSSPRTRPGVFIGSLRIDSTPHGARVFINRQEAGVTPLVVPKLGAGSHAVRVEADGYSSWSSAIRVIADRQTSVHAPLTPIASASILR